MLGTIAQKFRTSDVRYMSKYWKGVLASLLLALGVPLAVYLALRPQILRLIAAPGNAVLSVLPTNTTVGAGVGGTFEVWVNPGGENVSSIQLIMTYDPSIIRIDGVGAGDFFTSNAGIVGQPLEIIKDFSTPGEIRYAVSFPLSANIYSSTAVASTAKINFTSLSEGSTNIAFTTTGTILTKVNDSTGNNVLKSADSGIVNVSSGPRLYLNNLNPVNPEKVSTQFSIDLFMDSAGNQVSGVDARLHFDPAVLQVTNVVANAVSPFSSYPALTYVNTTGDINISANIGLGASATAVTGNGINVATITFNPISVSASSPITFNFVQGDRNDSNIVQFSASGGEPVDILSGTSPVTVIVQPAATTVPTVTASPSTAPTVPPRVPSPSVSPSPSGAPSSAPTASPSSAPTVSPSSAPTASPSPIAQTMTIALRFQGRSRAGAVQVSNVSLSYRPVGGAAVNLASPLTVNANSEVVTSLVPGNYIILVKANGYLARAFGTTANPVRIVQSSTFLDLTPSPLLGGDFNGDGVVNSVDYSLNFLNNFLKASTTVDLDGSGEVNNLDYGVMRSNWSLQSQAL